MHGRAAGARAAAESVAGGVNIRGCVDAGGRRGVKADRRRGGRAFSPGGIVTVGRLEKVVASSLDTICRRGTIVDVLGVGLLSVDK